MRGRVLVIAGIAALAVAAPARAATYTVTGIDDGTGSCTNMSCSTLRAAVTAANTAGGTNIIKLGAVTYTLHNELPVTSTLTVAGARADTTTIAEDLKSGRVFNVGAGGKLTVQHATLSNGIVGTGTSGGNIFATSGTTLILDHVRVTGGTATNGGGIAVASATTLQISHSLIDGNDASGGSGGGIYAVASPRLPGFAISITDSTVTGNTASTRAGIAVGGNTADTTTLTRSTVASNSAGSTDGGAGVDVADAESFTATGSIIAGNTGDGVQYNCQGTLTSGGGNVDSGARCGLATSTDLQNKDPGLGSLTATGGETPVLPITALSPAVDLTAIGAAVCAGTDQRDLARPQGGGCDAGAYEVDQAPDTAITSGPTGTIATASTSFGFSSTEPAVTFQCKLDGPGATTGTFAACTSPKAYSSLVDGSYTFSVRALDATGNTDASPATRAFTVDTTPPDTTIAAGPSGPTNNPAPSFSFSSTGGGTSFQCKLDGPGATTGTFAACTSPKAYSSLAAGTYTFSARALDAVGNIDPTPATRSFTVDTTAPDTSITSGPSGPTNNSSPSFGFASTETGSTFQCKLDGPGATTGTFAACTTPKNYSALTDGAYAFSVRATDAAGNTDATPATRSFTVDTAVPDTTITSGPTGPTNNASPSFAFSSPDATATFQCKLDGPGATTGTFAACTTPKAYAGLADGSYTFSVRAVDAAGNADSTPATRSITVDTVAPDTTINSGPSGATNDASPSFGFSSPDATATFQCKLDGPGATTGTFAACTTPKAYPGLADGSYTLTVRAVDAAGNVDSTPSTRAFTVDTAVPDTTITSGPSGTIAGNSPSFEFNSSEAGATFQCELDGPGGTVGSFAACTTPKGYSGLDNGTYTFSVRARDAAGNTDATPDTHTFTVDTTPPDTTITSGPAGTIATNAASFGFTSTDPAATFECRLDGPGATTGTFASCASPHDYTALADGTYTFSVRARDAVGKADSSPATRSFTVDTTTPDTSITSGPTGTVATNAASFGFTSPDGTATFQCRLDGPGGAVGAFAACTTPKAYSGLADGSYTFRVRALDPAGNVDAAPATRAFAIDTSPPKASIVSGPTGDTANASPSFAFSTGESNTTLECRLDGPNGAVHAFGPCTSPKSFAGLAPGAYTFFLRARDSAGNTTVTSRPFTVEKTQSGPKPQPNETVVVSPATGHTLIKLPGSKRFVPLDATKGIPLGSIVDTRRGRVRLSAIRRPGQPLETALFYGGIFKVTQTTAVTQLRLVQRLTCSAPAKKASAARKRVTKRRLWGTGKGRFRTRGQYSSATVRGTKWLVEDSCDQTLTRVARGIVAVQDFVRHRTIQVKAGHRYTARKR